MNGIRTGVAGGLGVAAVTVNRIGPVLVVVVLVVPRCRAAFLPAIGADRSKTELQRHAHQEKDR